MAFTMHSHSGQFCPGHAVDQLEDIVRHAVSVGFKTMGLTEHMPRYEERDLYPEERDDPQKSLDALPPRHEAYLAEAQRLQAKYASSIHILIGFEAEFIRPDFAPRVRALAAPSCVDYFIGSVHHVHGLPIDYDAPTYAAAVAAAGGSEERLFENYYDLQHDMLLALEPRVVGHFDLVRLLSQRPGRDVRQWEGVWAKVKRNLELVARQGGWLECNTAALRKGLDEPYPCRAIADEWLKLGGRFTLSDDSHGIAHIATNYARGIAYLESLGVEHVWTFRRCPPPEVESSTTAATLEETAVSLGEFRKHFN
ncbi:PHP domain-containing protein [Hirsutella rhossiliensis]|uniref:Histidinol-phosphatase n=1 Tax=Hirsutella rhossiliensis TaxID=111463 RepID=A0A9P8SGB6_9HYPO|nr:PHP domain-containing protein [Hirsutella rhossiliensis]KAH0960964.1 PHP domain-containing protein [Hirsutella rhossiliensis]